MGLGGFFKKIGKGAFDVFNSPIGDIVILKFVPKELQGIVQKAREVVRELEAQTHEPEAPVVDPREAAYREIAGELIAQGVQYSPSDVYALIEDVLKEHKGEAVIR